MDATTVEGRRYGVVRAVALVVAVLSLLLVVALAAPEKADAHQIAGRTVIYLDGKKIFATKDDHFVYRRKLVRDGCHHARAVQKQQSDVTLTVSSSSCSDAPSHLVVSVDDHHVGVRLYD